MKTRAFLVIGVLALSLCGCMTEGTIDSEKERLNQIEKSAAKTTDSYELSKQSADKYTTYIIKYCLTGELTDELLKGFREPKRLGNPSALSNFQIDPSDVSVDGIDEYGSYLHLMETLDTVMEHKKRLEEKGEENFEDVDWAMQSWVNDMLSSVHYDVDGNVVRKFEDYLVDKNEFFAKYGDETVRQFIHVVDYIGNRMVILVTWRSGEIDYIERVLRF